MSLSIHTPDNPRRSKGRLWRSIAIGTVALLIAAIVVTGAVSYDVVSHLIHPTRRPITKTPADVALAYRDVTFPSTVDHLQLSGWLIPAAEPTKKLVIEAHGYRQNRSSDVPALPVAAALHKAGFAVLMFDFRAQGQSPGHEVSVGLFEQRDLRGAIAFAHQQGYRHIGVIGYSMGAATALEVGAQDANVAAIVADSAFANLQRYLENHMPTWSHLPSWPFTPAILLELRLFFQLDAALVDPEGDAPRLGQRPVLLIAGTADTTIPASNSEALYQALRHDKLASLWLVPDAKHVGAYTVEPERYLQRVVAFFKHHL